MFIQLCVKAFLSASPGTASFNDADDLLLGDFKEQILLILIHSLIDWSVTQKGLKNIQDLDKQKHLIKLL